MGKWIQGYIYRPRETGEVVLLPPGRRRHDQVYGAGEDTRRIKATPNGCKTGWGRAEQNNCDRDSGKGEKGKGGGGGKGEKGKGGGGGKGEKGKSSCRGRGKGEKGKSRCGGKGKSCCSAQGLAGETG